MICVPRGPEAETIVMFDNGNDQFAARIFDGCDPLTAVQGGGVEDRRRLATVAPLDTAKRIGAKVNKKGALQPHPRRLVGTWEHLGRLLGNDGR